MSEPKVYILHENLEWTQHLTKWLEKKEIPYELWDLSSGILDLQSTPPEGIFYSRMSASSHTRGNRYAVELAQQVIKWLESHGRKVLNGSAAIDLEISKLKQYLALERNDIAYPKTVAAVGKDHILEAARKLNTYPLVTKHNRAGKGLGVYLFNSEEELKTYVESNVFEPSVDGITLVQQYIKPFDGHIRRSEFIGGRFFYTVAIDSSDGFELCPADECVIKPRNETNQKSTEPDSKFKIIDPLEKERQEQYEQFLKNNGISVAAVEWVEDENHTIYVYDVNTNTNYNASAEEKAGVFAQEQIADYLDTLLKEQYSATVPN